MSYFLFASKFIGVAHRQIVHMANYINAASLHSLGSHKLCICVSKMSGDVCLVSHHYYLCLVMNLRVLRKMSVILSLIITSFYYSLLIY